MGISGKWVYICGFYSSDGTLDVQMVVGSLKKAKKWVKVMKGGDYERFLVC